MTKISLSLCILLPSAAVSAFSIRPLTAPAGYTLKETVCRTHTMQQDGFRFDKQPPHSYLVRRSGSFRIVFPDGRAASDTAYRNAKCAEPYGYILQDSNGKWGLADGKGRQILPPSLGQISDFRHGLAILSNRSDGQHDKNTRYGYIDRQGKIVQPARFTAASPLAEEIDKRIYGRATDAQVQHWKISPSGQAERD